MPLPPHLSLTLSSCARQLLPDLRAALVRLDRAGSGLVLVPVFANMVRNLGVALSPADVDRISSAYADERHRVKYEVFLHDLEEVALTESKETPSILATSKNASTIEVKPEIKQNVESGREEGWDDEVYKYLPMFRRAVGVYTKENYKRGIGTSSSLKKVYKVFSETNGFSNMLEAFISAVVEYFNITCNNFYEFRGNGGYSVTDSRRGGAEKEEEERCCIQCNIPKSALITIYKYTCPLFNISIPMSYDTFNVLCLGCTKENVYRFRTKISDYVQTLSTSPASLLSSLSDVSYGYVPLGNLINFTISHISDEPYELHLNFAVGCSSSVVFNSIKHRNDKRLRLVPVETQKFISQLIISSKNSPSSSPLSLKPIDNDNDNGEKETEIKGRNYYISSIRAKILDRCESNATRFQIFIAEALLNEGYDKDKINPEIDKLWVYVFLKNTLKIYMTDPERDFILTISPFDEANIKIHTFLETFNLNVCVNNKPLPFKICNWTVAEPKRTDLTKESNCYYDEFKPNTRVDYHVDDKVKSIVGGGDYKDTKSTNNNSPLTDTYRYASSPNTSESSNPYAKVIKPVLEINTSGEINTSPNSSSPDYNNRNTSISEYACTPTSLSTYPYETYSQMIRKYSPESSNTHSVITPPPLPPTPTSAAPSLVSASTQTAPEQGSRSSPFW